MDKGKSGVIYPYDEPNNAQGLVEWKTPDRATVLPVTLNRDKKPSTRTLRLVNQGRITFQHHA